MQSRVTEILSGLLLFGLTLLLFWGTLGGGPIEIEAARNPIWYPRILLTLAGLASTGLLLRGVMGRSMSLPHMNYARLTMVTAVLGVYFWCFGSVGFLLTSVVLIPVLALILGYRRIALAVVVSALFSIGVWYLFADVFVVRPPGAGVDTFFQMLQGN